MFGQPGGVRTARRGARGERPEWGLTIQQSKVGWAEGAAATGTFPRGRKPD